jgi:hypothetical protein
MFGFFKGKISISLERYQFAPGDEIVGKLDMELKKNINAKGVSIQLLGKEQITNGSGRDRRTDTNTLFDFSLPLDGEREYLAHERKSYDFKIKIPDNVLDQKQGMNVGANIGIAPGGGLSFGASLASRRIDWYVVGRLDSPGFDVTKKVKVNIG